MNIDFSVLKRANAKNILGYCLILLNVTACIYIITAAALAPAGVAANAFAVLFSVTILFDMFWGALSKRRQGFWLIAGIAAALLVNYLAQYLVTLSVFENSFSVAAVFALFLIPAASIESIVLDLLEWEDKPPKAEKLRKVCVFLAKPAFSVALLVVAILGYDAVYNVGQSVHAYTTTRAGLLLLFEAVALTLLLVRLFVREGDKPMKEKLKSEFAFLLIAAVISGLGIGFFSAANAKVEQDAAEAKASYVEAFGSEIFEKREEGFSQMPFNLSQYFLGIPTTGYTLTRNIVYTDEGITQSGNLLTLSFDAYLPDPEKSVNSVLISIHGRSGDKDTGNYAQKHKYFASRGYTVFDLQVGDFNERNTGFPKEDWATYPNMARNILLFLDYLKENADSYRANLDSVFITGGSMGGGLTMMTGLTFAGEVAAKGITIRGLIPYYPAYSANREAEEDFLRYVDSTSPPCLMVMGRNDGDIDKAVIEYTDQAYEEKADGKFAAVLVSSAGHGCDGMFVGRANQIINYFVERFMAQMR